MIVLDTEALWLNNNSAVLIAVVTRKDDDLIIWDLRNPLAKDKLKEYLLSDPEVLTWNGNIDIVRLEEQLGIKLTHYDLKKPFMQHKIINYRNMLDDAVYRAGIKHEFTVKKWQTMRLYYKLRNMTREEQNKADITLIIRKCIEDTNATYKLYKYAQEKGMSLKPVKVRDKSLLYGEL